MGVFYEVFNELGGGFLESVYYAAMALGLAQAGVSFKAERRLSVFFRGQAVGVFKADFVIEGVVVAEVKAARSIQSGHEAQLLNYLRATTLEVGLILNFGPTPTFKRLVLSPDHGVRASR
ncbi:MAG: GxxExxY protein [Gemmatimonadota bacterium]|nr:GxxExxY protein [Gemmatimonadota bacterium]